MHILSGLLDDRSIDGIIQGIPSSLVKKIAPAQLAVGIMFK
jgi:hypothetical protein